MLNRSFSISILNDLLIFAFVFSFFNDNFFVESFGEKVLKILFILFIISNGSVMIKNLRSMNSLEDKLFFIYFIALLIIFLIQNILNISSDFIRSTFTLVSILVVIIFFSRYELKKLLYFVWFSMMASVVICFFNDPISPWTFRTSGGTGDPNEFAAQLLAFIFTSIYLYSKNKSKFFLGITSIFFIYGLFKAGSMSSFLMLGIILMLLVFKYVFYHFKNIFNYKLLLFLVIMLFAAMQLEFTKINAVSNMLNRSKDTHTADYRINSWVAGQHMIENHVLIGVGVNEFAKNTEKYAETYIHSPAPHNIFIQIFAESGVIIFVLFFIFIIALLFQNFTTIINTSEIWLFIALVSLLLMGMTLGIGFDKYFILYIAIIMNIRNSIRNHLKCFPSESDTYNKEVIV